MDQQLLDDERTHTPPSLARSCPLGASPLASLVCRHAVTEHALAIPLIHLSPIISLSPFHVPLRSFPFCARTIAHFPFLPDARIPRESFFPAPDPPATLLDPESARS
ncbi:unnamed protein product [Periconia digitata]|uniref:Uncharacterized protein n=1 Tax=Periconia digitata TaxID=1303443 RepID=A0A9W4U8B4_9PLEO|nr:unnamed protein product [Periconia digitata]